MKREPQPQPRRRKYRARYRPELPPLQLLAWMRRVSTRSSLPERVALTRWRGR